jgi:hypothetical protein
MKVEQDTFEQAAKLLTEVQRIISDLRREDAEFKTAIAKALAEGDIDTAGVLLAKRMALAQAYSGAGSPLHRMESWFSYYELCIRAKNKISP